MIWAIWSPTDDHQAARITSDNRHWPRIFIIKSHLILWSKVLRNNQDSDGPDFLGARACRICHVSKLSVFDCAYTYHMQVNAKWPGLVQCPYPYIHARDTSQYLYNIIYLYHYVFTALLTYMYSPHVGRLQRSSQCINVVASSLCFVHFTSNWTPQPTVYRYKFSIFDFNAVYLSILDYLMPHTAPQNVCTCTRIPILIKHCALHGRALCGSIL